MAYAEYESDSYEIESSSACDNSEAEKCLEKVKVGTVFSNWKAVEFFVKELRENLHMPLIYAEKRSASSYNKNVIFACCKLYVFY